MAARAPPAGNTPRESNGWWGFGDLKAAYAKYEADPTAADAGFHLGRALQMAGQADDSQDQYKAFHAAAVARHGSHSNAVAYYDDRLQNLIAFKDRSPEEYDQAKLMLRVICECGAKAKRRSICRVA
mmetsp:Transcript_9943/g.34368  ORF Transcript_9943/g.34368 Transcript_9943/m.34368 type:complete len:127 (-) Transcript_9943:25-405(-)